MKLESRITDIVTVGADGETVIVQALKATLRGNTHYYVFASKEHKMQVNVFAYSRKCLARNN